MRVGIQGRSRVHGVLRRGRIPSAQEARNGRRIPRRASIEGGAPDQLVSLRYEFEGHVLAVARDETFHVEGRNVGDRSTPERVEQGQVDIEAIGLRSLPKGEGACFIWKRSDDAEK